MASQDGKKRNIYGFIVFLICVYAIVSLFAFSSDVYRKSINFELDQTASQLGKHEWDALRASATERYTRWYVTSGFEGKLQEMLLPAQDTKHVVINNLLTEKYNYRFVNNVAYTVFQAAFRVEMLKFWFYLTLPVVIAIIATGYYKWRMNRYTVSSGNTMFVRMFLKSIAVSLFLIVLYVLMPHLRVPYSFYVPLVAITLTSLAISRVIAAFHKDF